jgi:hypothetical protein
MNRDDFQKLSRLRQAEASALLKAKHYPGAYYLLGYSVECGLKACIAKKTVRYDFPTKNAKDFYTHDLVALLKLSELESALKQEVASNPVFEVNWALVRLWSERSRYENHRTLQEAADLHAACVSRKNGVLTWIRKQW